MFTQIFKNMYILNYRSVNHMNHKIIATIFTIILITVTAGCADKPSMLNSGAGYKISYSLVPVYLGVLSSPDNIKPEPHYIHPVFRDEKEEFDNIISQADKISKELELRVQSLDEEGKDVEKLKSLLDEYNTLIASAKTYREISDNIEHESCSDPGCEAMEKEFYLQLSRNNLKKSNAILSDIFNEFKRMLPGHVELKDDCILSATGSGRVLLAGDLSANISIRNGILHIIGLPGNKDFPMDIIGKYEIDKSEKVDNRLLYYKIIDATILGISPQKSAFIIEGSEISITAKGTGTVDFFGNGTYTIICQDGSSDKMQWDIPKVRRTINSPNIYSGIR